MGELKCTDRLTYGQFFTPMTLADRLVSPVLERLKGLELEVEEYLKLEVLDPAVGCGSLLRSWCYGVADVVYGKLYGEPGCIPFRFSSKYESILREVRRNCYGIDVDGDCVQQARKVLAALCSGVFDGSGQIVCDDFLFRKDNRRYDVVLMNPPYIGGVRISPLLGEDYRLRLKRRFSDYHGEVDIAGYFIQQAGRAVTEDGLLSVLATNTTVQTKTREVGFERLLRDGFRIYDVERDVSWPGDASVVVNLVHLAGPRAAAMGGGIAVEINSRLEEGLERSKPKKLATNLERVCTGPKLVGMGFVLTPEERDDFVQRDPRNVECIYPYVTGLDMVKHPRQEYSRYAIYFGKVSLEEAYERWPLLVERLRATVKVERESRLKYKYGPALAASWWLPKHSIPKMAMSYKEHSRVLVCSRTTKHLVLSFVPTQWMLSGSLLHFCFDCYSWFGLLQSRVHEVWARLLGATMGKDLRYSISDCFETFPVPPEGELEDGSLIDRVGKVLYERRASYLEELNVGLGKAYNILKDPCFKGGPEVELRGLHEELDRAVLAAYGWDDIEVPPFTSAATGGERRAYAAFREEVLRRLFDLNTLRGEKSPQLEF